MKKVCFLADHFAWEEGMYDRLYQELEEPCLLDDRIEFWFL